MVCVAWLASELHDCATMSDDADYDDMDDEQLEALMAKEEAEAAEEIARLEREAAAELDEEDAENDMIATDADQFSARRNMFEEEATSFAEAAGSAKQRLKDETRRAAEQFDIEDAITSVDVSANIQAARRAERKEVLAAVARENELARQQKEREDALRRAEEEAIEEVETRKNKSQLKAERKARERAFIQNLQDELAKVCCEVADNALCLLGALLSPMAIGRSTSTRPARSRVGLYTLHTCTRTPSQSFSQSLTHSADALTCILPTCY